jgi:hypothetical protein
MRRSILALAAKYGLCSPPNALFYALLPSVYCDELHCPRVKCFTAPGSRQVDADLRKEIAMTNVELWLVNMVALTTLFIMTMYFIRASF